MMIKVPEPFRQMPRWWRDQLGREWLDNLPALVSEQCRRWSLTVEGEPLYGSNALVIPVCLRDNNPAVLRLSPPGDDVTDEAAALRWWAGRGTVRLFDVDLASRAMLLERLGSRSLQSEPLFTAIPVIAALVRELAVPAPPGTTSTAAIAADHVVTAEHDWLALDRPTPRAQLHTAVRLAGQLARTSTSGLAVDGDLHSEQVLQAGRAPWLVVDPVLLCGDPEYDFGRVLWSRLDELATDTDITTIFDVFVREAGVPAERARSWVVVRSMSYLLWGLRRGLTWDPPKCRRLLNLFC
ncbi:aminoglycoside phosphotransferase family protein [uncultured Friedmanniella sp.]|uniref:aminoglycoside phosphotransferase family protein n=1 Tax=uncultured Friedmanniella sp. TaxID=335381 RepID=UPI0035CC7506